MKKVIALAALACAAMGMNAELVNYDFNNTPLFFPTLQAPVTEGGMGVAGNYNFILNTNAVGVPYGVGAGDADCLLCESYVDSLGNTKWRAREDLRVRISLEDGISYGLNFETGVYEWVSDGFSMQLDETKPFIGYGDKGPTRVVWLYGIGNDSTYVDANYNAVNEANWVATKHGLQFARGGNNASRTDTYVQFPEFQGPFSCTYYICSTSDTNRNKEQALMCRVVPVKDNVELEDYAQITNVAYADHVEKRYYKKEFYYPGTDKVSLRIGANGAQMVLMHATFANGGDSALDQVIAPAEDENAPVYNIMGQRVNADYKGLVIKNGKKYIQK